MLKGVSELIVVLGAKVQFVFYAASPKTFFFLSHCVFFFSKVGVHIPHYTANPYRQHNSAVQTPEISGCSGAHARTSQKNAINLTAGTAYTAGPSPTAADFHLWEMLDQHEMLAAAVGRPSPLAGFPLLSGLHSALRAVPQLQGYFNGPLYALPVNNRMASFGGDIDAPRLPAGEL